ncbi:MAG: hypothetical protein ABL958_10615 [Bdellovibrionia bacterium]
MKISDGPIGNDRATPFFGCLRPLEAAVIAKNAAHPRHFLFLPFFDRTQ